MKSRLLSILVMTICLTSAARADTSVSVHLGAASYHDYERHEEDREHRGYWAYDRFGNRRYYQRHQMVEGVPVVVTPAPYYGGYNYPVYPPAPPLPPPLVAGLTGDYATDLAALNGKLAKLRAIVQRQNEKEAFSQEQYDRFTNALESIETDEHAVAFQRGGNLSPEDLSDLFRRLEQVSGDIQDALAQ